MTAIPPNQTTGFSAFSQSVIVREKGVLTKCGLGRNFAMTYPDLSMHDFNDGKSVAQVNVCRHKHISFWLFHKVGQALKFLWKHLKFVPNLDATGV